MKNVFTFEHKEKVPPTLKQETTDDIVHVSWRGFSGGVDFPKKAVLQPQVPNNTYARSEYDDPYAEVFPIDPDSDDPFSAFDPHEDSTTERVCFAKTIEDALDGAGVGKDEHFAVYKPVHPIKVVHPSEKPLKQFYGTNDPSKWFVDDVDETGEVWSLDPVPVKLVKIFGKKRS